MILINNFANKLAFNKFLVAVMEDYSHKEQTFYVIGLTFKLVIIYKISLIKITTLSSKCAKNSKRKSETGKTKGMIN